MEMSKAVLPYTNYALILHNKSSRLAETCSIYNATLSLYVPIGRFTAAYEPVGYLTRRYRSLVTRKLFILERRD